MESFVFVLLRVDMAEQCFVLTILKKLCTIVVMMSKHSQMYFLNTQKGKGIEHSVEGRGIFFHFSNFVSS